jgi:hypothetical protein
MRGKSAKTPDAPARLSQSRKIAARVVLAGVIFLGAHGALGQIQVELKFPRLQFISYEPVYATVSITNLAGRDIELQTADEQEWFGFDVTGAEGQLISPTGPASQPPLRIGAGQKVIQKVNITPLFAIHELGLYHVRAHIYFRDLGKFFYSPARVIEVTDARPIWQQTVGVPEGSGPGGARTYSLMTNRFPDHTSLYVRVADKETGIVYATYSLGRMILYEDPKVQIDAQNRLHVLHCSAPRTWSYAIIGINGELVTHSSLSETKSRPHLVRANDGMINVHGGVLDVAVPANEVKQLPKLSDRPE